MYELQNGGTKVNQRIKIPSYFHKDTERKEGPNKPLQTLFISV